MWPANLLDVNETVSQHQSAVIAKIGSVALVKVRLSKYACAVTGGN
jgi:hypothetical protein